MRKRWAGKLKYAKFGRGHCRTVLMNGAKSCRSSATNNNDQQPATGNQHSCTQACFSLVKIIVHCVLAIQWAKCLFIDCAFAFVVALL